MPNLYLFLGPNGAGKSSYSNEILSSLSPGLKAYDGDIVYREMLRGVDPGLDKEERKEIAFDLMLKDFSDKVENAFKSKSDFAYEGNFNGPNAMQVPSEFKRKGYSVHVFFMGMEMDKCVERVRTRAFKGGHNVPLAEISKRYESGMMNIAANFHKFDSILFLDNSGPSTKFVADFEKGKRLKKRQPQNEPKWFRSLELKRPVSMAI